MRDTEQSYGAEGRQASRMEPRFYKESGASDADKIRGF